MVFRPFGQRFDLVSLMAPDAAKAAIRARKAPWFAVKSGARGWLVGPFVCLWFTALDSNGPALYGRIRAEAGGTRISGWVGSDLSGFLIALVLVPAMLLLLYEVFVAGSGPWLLSFGLPVGLGALLLLAKLAFRRDAEPLLRFLRDTVAPEKPKLAKVTATKGAAAIDPGLRMIVNGAERCGPLTATAIDQALRACAADDFVILASAPETYLQTLALGHSSYAIEKREGDSAHHFAATRSDAGPAEHNPPAGAFSLDEVLAVLLAYRSGGAMPEILGWKSIRI